MLCYNNHDTDLGLSGIEQDYESAQARGGSSKVMNDSVSCRSVLLEDDRLRLRVFGFVQRVACRRATYALSST